MNKNVLKKCIDELGKEKPRLDYVLGALETLYDSSSSGLAQTQSQPTTISPFMQKEGKIWADSGLPIKTAETDPQSIADTADRDAFRTMGLIEKELSTETNIVLDNGGRKK